MSIAALFLSAILVAAILYGGSIALAWVRANRSRFNTKATALMVSAWAMLISVVPAFAQEDPAPTLEFDLTPFFDSLNVYLPIFIGLFAIIGGIAGAIALARFVINSVVNAFKGGSL